MRKTLIDCALELKKVTDDGDIEGYAAVFGNIDYGYDRIEPGAFKETLKGIESLPMLWQHRPDEPIGVFSEFEETRKGLFVKGSINQDVQRGREARSLAAQGAVTGMSIGYWADEYYFDDEVRVLSRVSLLETSLVTFPMNDRARVTGVKNATRKELERMLRANMGLSRQAAEALCAGGAKALNKFLGSGESGASSGQSREESFGIIETLRNMKQELRK